MQFINWIGTMISALWNVLDFDLLGIGINFNMLLLGLSLFSLMITFFQRIGSIEHGGVSALDSFKWSSVKKSMIDNRKKSR